MTTGDRSTSPRRLRHVVVRHTRRTVVFVAGWTVIAAGVAMLVLPGPGLLVVIAGLSILAVEFAWARRLRDRANERAKGAANAIRRRARRQ